MKIHHNSPSQLPRVCCRNSPSQLPRVFCRNSPQDTVQYSKTFNKMYCNLSSNYLECVVEIPHNSPSQLPRVCCSYAAYCEFTDMSFYIFYFRNLLHEGWADSFLATKPVYSVIWIVWLCPQIHMWTPRKQTIRGSRGGPGGPDHLENHK